MGERGVAGLSSDPAPGQDEERLLGLFRSLQAADRRSLLAFAAFLAAGGGRVPEVDGPGRPRPAVAAGEAPGGVPAISEPRVVPRPQEETVIAAIRRLSGCYFMLERRALLHETAALMSAHLVQGRPAGEVIDELESLFARHYEAYRRAGS